MTKSTITRERLKEIVSDPMINQGSEFAMMARMALVAMDSESWRLPLDYLQGHKDGMEWAARLAEANHPETGDWLYDDPIELAKAIRKGPDMPPAQPVADSEPVAEITEDLGRLFVKIHYPTTLKAGDKLYRHAQPETVVLDGLIKAVEFYEQVKRENPPVETGAWKDAVDWVLTEACRAAMLRAQSDDDGEPTDDERIMAIEGIHNCERCGDEGWIVGEMGITRCACGQADNSPVFPGAEQRIADAVELLKKAAPAMLADNGDPDGPLAGRMKPEVISDGYMMVPKEPTEAMLTASYMFAHVESPRESWAAMLAATPQSPGSEPATVPGKWIPVSERMPESNGVYFGWDGKRVLEVYCFFGGFSANQFIHGEITHWMPLPAAPQEDINALIPLASRNEQEGK